MARKVLLELETEQIEILYILLSKHLRPADFAMSMILNGKNPNLSPKATQLAERTLRDFSEILKASRDDKVK